MKKLSYLLSAGVLVAMLAVVGCKKDDGGGITPEDAAGANFAGTWVVDASQTCQVVFDNCSTGDRTTEYNQFSLTFVYDAGLGSGKYSRTGGQPDANPWPVGGIWSFTTDAPNENSFSIIRDQGNAEETKINVTINGSTMELLFFYNGPASGGRIDATEGDWTFILTKQ